MARVKKAVAKTAVEVKPKEKKITLTSEQFEALKTATNDITSVRRLLSDMQEGIVDLAQAGFITGQAYQLANKAEDALDEMVNELDPTDYDLEF